MDSESLSPRHIDLEKVEPYFQTNTSLTAEALQTLLCLCHFWASRGEWLPLRAKEYKQHYFGLHGSNPNDHIELLAELLDAEYLKYESGVYLPNDNLLRILSEHCSKEDQSSFAH